MWDQRYSEPGHAYGTEPNDFVVEQAGRLRPRGRVLCLAEGQGRNAVYLASLGHDVTAVDLSPVGLTAARALAGERGLHIHTEVADLATFDLGQSRWDGIVSIWCHVPSAVRASLHHRVVSALTPGGLFLLEAYTPDQLAHRTGGPPTAELLYTEPMLREDLAGLDIVFAEEREREVHEGKYHQGLSAVVRLVAQRPV